MLEEIIKFKLRKFATDRDWEQFHSPVNLVKSICIEAAELLELFQWSNAPKRDPSEEMADVAIYLIRLADVLDIDLEEAIKRKIKANDVKYPAETFKGSSRKYNEA